MATKQKSGLYRTKIKISVDRNGKDVVKWVSGKTKKELEEARREVIAHYIDYTALNEDVILGEYTMKWYTEIKAPLLSESAKANYRAILNKHVLPAFGERYLRSITATELQNGSMVFLECLARRLRKLRR